MFEATHPFAFFDYFRVPYDVRGPALLADRGSVPGHVGMLRVSERDGKASRTLYWLREAGGPRTSTPGRHQLAGFTFFAQVADDRAVTPMLGGLGGGGWLPAAAVHDGAGRRVAAIWRDRDGNVFLPFDPAAVMQRFWSETYRNVEHGGLASRGRAAALRGYYLARPALPRAVQLGLRRVFAHAQGPPSFPRWPAENSLHDFYGWLFALIAEVAGRPVPFVNLWPAGRSWALVLTHDVETDAGQRQTELLREPERRRGFRSSWNFVGQRYDVDDALIRSLRDEGCEIGVHGLRHDGRDLGSRRLVDKRLPAIRQYAERWQAVGFRSPATQRDWDLMPRLGFDYDSSYTDTAPYEPQPGGCCSYLPFFNSGMVELPMTMPQDHTLFAILQHGDARAWQRKAEVVRLHSGMALVLTHPDYAQDARIADGYSATLGELAADSTLWHALPRDVAAWWRQRAASSIRRENGEWTVRGPAEARATVGFVPG